MLHGSTLPMLCTWGPSQAGRARGIAVPMPLLHACSEQMEQGCSSISPLGGGLAGLSLPEKELDRRAN